MAIHFQCVALAFFLIASFQCSFATSVAPTSRRFASRAMTRASMQSMEKTMTLEHAIQALPRLADHGALFASLLQRGAGHHRTHHRRVLRGHHRRGELGTNPPSATAPSTVTPAPGTGPADAANMLNEMIMESEEKLDLEEVRCSEFEERQLALMEETQQDIAMYNAMAAQARAAILAAQTQIEMISQKIPELNDQLAQLLAKCASEAASLRSQLSVLEGDITVINQVVEMSQCSESASSQVFVQLGMRRCKRETDEAETSEESFIEFTHHVLRKTVASLKSDVARKGLQRQLAQSFHETPQVPAALVQVGEMHTQPVPTSDTPDAQQAAAKCTIAASPACTKMRDRFLAIQTDIVDKRDALQQELRELELKCRTEKANFEGQISAFETRLKDQQSALAEATQAQNDAEEQSRLKSMQLAEVQSEYEKTMKECRGNIDQLKSEICGARKIRKEIYKMSPLGLTQLVQDCEVSDWVESPCSATCGGGTQELNRTVSLQPAYGGAACPPLVMSRACNDAPCPVDCVVNAWSGWSSCSAHCGGGVQERSRSVATPPQHGGERCGATTETEPCNMQSCDRDCELDDWNAWGPCSAMCNGGMSSRVRHVSAPAVGQGSCPEASSPQRTEYQECNSQPCIPFGTSPDTPLLCGSAGFGVKQDVIILLDGSGSLGNEGWTAVKAAGLALANAYWKDENTGAKVAVLVFGGPRYWSYFRSCTGHLTAGQTPPNMETECGLSWASHLSVDSAGIASAITALNFPQSTTFTSGALALALNELSNGRQDAQSVVYVITDGRPLRRSNTGEQSRRVRERARLIWVPVTQRAPINDIEEWASRPAHENIIEVDDFTTLSQTSTVNAMISKSCPNVHV